MRIGIGQYVIVRPLSTLVAVVSEALGWYCLASWSPGFTHLYTSAAITISVTVAMYNVVSENIVSSTRAEWSSRSKFSSRIRVEDAAPVLSTYILSSHLSVAPILRRLQEGARTVLADSQVSRRQGAPSASLTPRALILTYNVHSLSSS